MSGLNGDRRKRWLLTREKILMCCGLLLVGYESVIIDLIGEPFHFEIILAGLALCGVSISQWQDRR